AGVELLAHLTGTRLVAPPFLRSSLKRAGMEKKTAGPAQCARIITVRSQMHHELLSVSSASGTASAIAQEVSFIAL
ncbi:MAG TPA: hypothetical protein VHX16_18350, partial [Chloroflexota bacterium]|nr:hypothetical protein [Chloroflexota bacterium]